MNGMQCVVRRKVEQFLHRIVHCSCRSAWEVTPGRPDISVEHRVAHENVSTNHIADMIGHVAWKMKDFDVQVADLESFTVLKFVVECLVQF